MMRMRIDKRILLANLAVMAMAVVSYVNMNSIMLMQPLNGVITDDRMPVFTWSGQKQSYELLLDDEPGFGSPVRIEVTGNVHQLQQELPFGTYWWKVRSGGLESPARRFDLVSTVALSRLGPGMIRNSGNAELLVHSSGLTGAATLAVNQTLIIGEKENVKAEQK